MAQDDYRDYEDFYDNGPGSEAFKRSCRTTPLRTFPNLTPRGKRVLQEDEYQLAGQDMITITINIPKRQWVKWRQRFIEALALIRRS